MEENGVSLVCFEICGEKFAFDLEYLVEIVRVQPSEITPWYSPVPIIRGKCEYRGQTVSIIDLREFFGLQPTAEQSPQNATPEQGAKNILVISVGDQTFGLLTDKVLHMQPLSSYYEYPAFISHLPRRYFGGVTMREAELVILLAVENFVSAYELDILSGDAETEGA